MAVTGESKRAIDVLLVNPGSRMAMYQDLGDRYSAIEPPSLAGLIATYLRKRGLSVAIVDAPALNLSPAGVAATIWDSFEPEIIGFIESLGKPVADLSTEVLPQYLGRICTFSNADYHRDIGSPESLRRAELEFPFY